MYFFSAFDKIHCCATTKFDLWQTRHPNVIRVHFARGLAGWKMTSYQTKNQESSNFQESHSPFKKKKRKENNGGALALVIDQFMIYEIPIMESSLDIRVLLDCSARCWAPCACVCAARVGAAIVCSVANGMSAKGSDERRRFCCDIRS
jgi:hypothetical protein